MSRVAFFGLGAMGGRMAVHLLAAGHSLSVYNRTPARAAALVERGAVAAGSPRAAVAGADIVVNMVTDDAAARAVWLDEAKGALAGLGAETIAVDCSTLSVGCIDDLQRAFAQAGRAFLAAPVLGSLPQAEAKALIALAGGAPEVRERAQPVLAAMTGRIVPLATPAQAATLKLAINAVFSTQVAAFAELLAVLKGVALDPAAVLAAIADLPTTSPALAGAAGLMAKGDDAPRYPIRLVEKDLRYLMQVAEGRAPVIDAVTGSFARALARGFGDRNISAVARLLA